VRASSYMKKGEVALAVADALKVLSLDARSPVANYILGSGYERQGEIDQAIQQYTRVLELDEGHVNALFARASCLNRQGQFEKAIEDYSQALEIDSSRPLLLGSNLKSKQLEDRSQSKKSLEDDLIKPL
jgi:tetratricopeptide (TPR) repeat protein